MRNLAIILILSMGLALSGCGSAVPEQPEAPDENHLEAGKVGFHEEEDPADNEEEIPAEETVGMSVEQGGPYGRISIALPEGWQYVAYPVDSDDSFYGLYGIQFYPEDVEEGHVRVMYIDSFGVCGTGLVEKTATVAGKSASVGTYDNNEYWDFIAFNEDYKGIVAMTYFVDDWWDEYGDQVSDILDTLVFEQSVKEDSIYVFDRESENDEMGLSFSLKNISPTGATLVFRQFDEDAIAGELIYGDAFMLEQLKDGEWVSVPVVIENYGFNDIAHIIFPGDTAETELDWEWLYGGLAPGEYRIGKSVMDVTEAGGHDESMIYAHFILN